MKKADFEAIITGQPNILFAPSFLTRLRKLKFVSSEGEILSRDSSLRLHHYMRLSNVEEVMQKTLRFDVPSRWTDPFEKLFYLSPVTIGNKNYYVYCLCFSYYAERGEESLWYVHGGAATSTTSTNNSTDLKTCKVRATFDVQSLCKNLSKVNTDVKFYLAPVDYSHSRKEIIQHYQARKTNGYTDIEEFIGEMLLKRSAFSYEREIRLFAVSEDNLNHGRDFVCLPLNNGSKIITGITLPPLKIQPPLNQKTYKKQLEQEGIKMKNELHRIGYNGKIYQSRLYDVECKIDNLLVNNP